MTSEAKRQKLFSLLGDLPVKPDEVKVEKVKLEEKENYILETLLLGLNDRDLVPAYFVRPRNAMRKTPVVLFNHSHGGNYHIGKEELLCSTDYLQNPSFAEEFTNMGYSALCIDMWGFGERRGLTESEIFKEMLWNGQVMWGMMIYDSLKAIDYLFQREDVDSSRIAALGMSMGGLMSWWLSSLDERIKVCVDICGQVDAKTLIEDRGLDYHGLFYYVPGLLKYFETAEIQELLAPRPHLSLVGNYDKLTPSAGLKKIDRYLSSVYEQQGCPDHWKMSRFGCGHIETEGMRREACLFLQKYL